MKYHTIDNSLKDLGKVVLWQYDRAVRLLSVIKHMQMLYHCAVEQFWKFWTEKILSIDTCGAFGCSIWGILLGVPRPTIKDTNGTERLIATSVYRKCLKGVFYLMKSSVSYQDILQYLEIVFGISGRDNVSKWTGYVSEYGWKTNIKELNGEYDSGIEYIAGTVFLYDSNGDGVEEAWKCLQYISVEENTSFEAIASKVEQTTEAPTINGGSDTILLKLYDPEGICRKIGGAPSSSLSVSLSYMFGETEITASATRRRKCGVTLADNGDMSMTYGKSEYYDQMHKDQKLLFEQRMDEFCPFPLGVKTNEPVETWVLGFPGQENEQYEAGRAYEKGHIFGYVDGDGHAFNWKCVADITSGENTSFDKIRGKLEKTSEGDPFVSCLCDDFAFTYNPRGILFGSPLSSGSSGAVFSTLSDMPSQTGKKQGIGGEWFLHQTDSSMTVMSKGGSSNKGYPIETVTRDFLFDNNFALFPYESGQPILKLNNGEGVQGQSYGYRSSFILNGKIMYVLSEGTLNNGVFSGKAIPAPKTTLL